MIIFSLINLQSHDTGLRLKKEKKKTLDTEICLFYIKKNYSNKSLIFYKNNLATSRQGSVF